MKKILILTFNLFATFFVLAQTIVSTTSENKNVVLEEFTGIHCGYCPDGHARAKEIQDAHPDDVVIINIHTGSYANPSSGEPDFRTSFGDEIASQSDLTGYPSGTVNRHVFSGYEMTIGGTAQSRGNWATTSNLILSESSYVNIAIEAEINVQTRIMTVHVEAYYTGSSSQSTNKLNVVIMQNNTLGPQSGGGMGDEYVHMHRLVHMLTGQWGEDITTTNQGAFIDRTYTYTIPADYNGVTAMIQDMEVAAFVAEGNQEVISGATVEPSFINLSTNNNAGLEKIVVAKIICGNMVTPLVKIRNNGNNNLTSVDISYNVGGNTDSVHHWTGNLEPLKFAEFDLGEYEFTPVQTNSLNVEITSISGGVDEDESDNAITDSFDKSAEANNLVTLSLTTDQYANEISWKLFNSSGAEIGSGSGYSNNSTISETFHLDLDCYIFEIIDSYGDGGARYDLKDSDGLIIHSSTGSYGKGEDIPFKTITEVQTYSTTFNVTDGTNPIENAEINLTSFGTQTTDASGVAIFNDVYPKNDIDYTITTTGFDSYSDRVSVIDENVTVDVVIILTGFADLKSESFSIYPNPTNGILYVKHDEFIENTVLKVITINGKEILKQKIDENITSLDLSIQPKGFYFIKIVSADSERVSKFIIE
ncbi:MAG: hypothetical protein DRJ07_02135 [Bacteroidetes bacterium]|nr:MAG: hypothetical protein DRJ07_02135 [Bacteroidota bacterium]